MRISRLLALPLVLSFAALAAAQSAPSPRTSPPVFPTPPLLAQPAPAAAQTSPAPQAPAYDFPVKPLLAQPNASAPAPDLLLKELAARAALRFRLGPRLATHPYTLLAGPERCYTIRDYSFSRDDPNSDALRLKSYTACEPSTEARLLHTGPPARNIAP